MTLESKICKTCGTPISQGAFLGLCAACSEGEGSTKTVAVTSRSNSTKGWIVLGVVVAVLLFLYFILAADSIDGSSLAPVKMIESSSSPVEAESPF